MTDIRGGISRERLAQLIAELRQLRVQREAVEAIRAAGLQGDTWLVQCLLCESEAKIWDAWEGEE